LKGDYKVLGGKMIRVTIEEEDNRIKRIVITGDFFYPEEAFPQFEQALIGVKADEEEITEAVNLAYEKLRVVSVGAESEDFVAAIIRTLRGRPDA
jgi:lipoate-protein ligase A